MRYLVNIGNTHTEFVVAEAGELGGYTRIPTADLCAGKPLLPEKDAVLHVASVVPPALEVLVGNHGKQRVKILTAESAAGLDFSLVDGSTLGADRVANALAAQALYGGPVIVLDCGTAITTETVDRDGRFRGGAIMPGRFLLRKSLHDYTAQLPLVKISPKVPQALGTTTEEAMLAGIDCGVLGAVSRILQQSRRELGLANCPVVAVGGDADFFAEHLEGVKMAAPLFTLRGIATQLPKQI